MTEPVTVPAGAAQPDPTPEAEATPEATPIPSAEPVPGPGPEAVPGPGPEAAGAEPVPGPEAAGAEPVPEAEADARSLGQEAAKYRRQLRETEAQRDELAHKLDALTRQLVNSHLPGWMPARAFWLVTPDTSELTGEDGTVDPAKVEAAALVALDKLGMPQQRPGAEALRNVGRIPDLGPQRPAWTDAFRPKSEPRRT